MITVMEIWHLKPGLDRDALQLMQEMDDLVGPPAHEHPGWCGHARFYRCADSPMQVVMIYPWRSRELHQDLVMREEETLRDFTEKCCTRAREINYYTELPVDVEHDKDDAHRKDS